MAFDNEDALSVSAVDAMTPRCVNHTQDGFPRDESSGMSMSMDGDIKTQKDPTGTKGSTSGMSMLTDIDVQTQKDPLATESLTSWTSTSTPSGIRTRKDPAANNSSSLRMSTSISADLRTQKDPQAIDSSTPWTSTTPTNTDIRIQNDPAETANISAPWTSELTNGDIRTQNDPPLNKTSWTSTSTNADIKVHNEIATTNTSTSVIMVDETTQARVERLGRARPEAFSSLWKEVGFVFSISMSQVLSEYFVSGFTVVLPTLSKDLQIPAASTTWPASAFSLVVASFLLVFGRFADMYGGYSVYVAGMLWLAIWSLIASFSQNPLMLDLCRALQGFGPAAFLPSGMMLLGCNYRPGPRKNIVLSIYGACAPLGFFAGIFFAGIAGEFARWGTYFWVGGALAVITAVTAYLTVPSDIAERRGMGVKMDWWGAIFTVVGLVLFTFAVIDSSHAPNRWKNPYILTTLVLGLAFLVVAGYVEAYIAESPLLPSSFFKVPCMKPLVLALFLTYGSLGIFLLYATFYMETVMTATPFQIVAWYIPMALGGCIISTIGGYFLHLVPNTILLLVSGTCWIISPLLFAISPVNASYWAYVFPSMVCATIGIDITFNVTNIFVTTSLPRREQGLAGAVVMWLMHAGIAICLGWADVVDTYSLGSGAGQRGSWKRVFWLEVTFATIALAILVLGVRVKAAESELTVDEREELELELRDVAPGVPGTPGVVGGHGVLEM